MNHTGTVKQKCWFFDIISKIIGEILKTRVNMEKWVKNLAFAKNRTSIAFLVLEISKEMCEFWTYFPPWVMTSNAWEVANSEYYIHCTSLQLLNFFNARQTTVSTCRPPTTNSRKNQNKTKKRSENSCSNFEHLIASRPLIAYQHATSVMTSYYKPIKILSCGKAD